MHTSLSRLPAGGRPTAPRGPLALPPLAPLAALALVAGASGAPPSGPLLSAYDFSRGAGIQTELPRGLREVSGLAVGPGGRLFAHDDERAVIFEVEPTTGEALKTFSAGIGGVVGDFEGIAAAEGRFFLVSSAGEILEVEEGAAGAALQYRVHVTGLGQWCEVEGLAYDPVTDSFLLPCKEPSASRLREHVVVFSVARDSMELYPIPRVFLPWRELEALGLDAEFHPSAVEIDPATGNILLLAGREESLLELTREGRLLGGVELPRKDHPQPEGLALLPDGTLLIADEGDGDPGLLTRYRPAPPGSGSFAGGGP